jgi:hypothetical protein
MKKIYFKLFLEDFAESKNLSQIIRSKISIEIDINEDMINAKEMNIRKLRGMVGKRNVVEPIGNDLAGILD